MVRETEAEAEAVVGGGLVARVERRRSDATARAKLCIMESVPGPLFGVEQPG